MKSVVILVVDEPSIEGGGHARLVIKGMGRAHRTELTFKIRRQSDVDASLGPRGWQSGDHLFDAHEVTVEGEDLLLLAGPEVCAHVDDYTAIEVIVPDLAINGLLVWEGVTPPFEYNPVELPPEPEEEPEPEEPQQPQKAPVTAGAATFKSAADGIIRVSGTLQRGEAKETFEKHLNVGDTLYGLSYDPLKEAGQGRLTLDVEENVWLIEKTAPPPPPPSPTPPEAGDKKSNLWIILILLFALGVGAAGYLLWPDWYETVQTLWSDPGEEQAAVPTPSPDETPPPTPAPAPTPSPPASPVASCPQSPSLGLAEALEHLETARSSTEQSEQTQSYDSARHILRCGINAGHGVSMMLYADIIDSIEFEAGFVTEPDNFQALELYRKACENQTNVSADRLGRLKSAIEEDAAQGNATASQTLLLLWPKVEEACL